VEVSSMSDITLKNNQNDYLDDLKWCMTANLCGYLTRSDSEFINEVCRKAYEEIRRLRGDN
jgi:hypothetical protein